MTWPLETRRWIGWCHVVAYSIWINIVTFMSIVLQFNAFILLFPDLLYLSDSEIHCAAFWINQSLWDDELYSFLTLSKDVCVLHSPCLVTSVIQLWLPKFVFPLLTFMVKSPLLAVSAPFTMSDDEVKTLLSIAEMFSRLNNFYKSLCYQASWDTTLAFKLPVKSKGHLKGEYSLTAYFEFGYKLWQTYYVTKNKNVWVIKRKI